MITTWLFQPITFPVRIMQVPTKLAFSPPYMKIITTDDTQFFSRSYTFTNNAFFSPIALSHEHFCSWASIRLIDIKMLQWAKRDAAPKVKKSSTSKAFHAQERSHSWHRILLVICKLSTWAFYRWAMALSLNGNPAAVLNLKKC